MPRSRRQTWAGRIAGGGALLLAGALAALVVSASGDHPKGFRAVTADPVARPSAPPAGAGPAVEGRTVVVVLFDGLSAEMLAGVETPTFDRLQREGAWTHHLVPAFPTVSLVNGFTLTTGCWPARHGIVHNRFLDPRRGLYDHSKDADWIADCEPLHQAAERQGVRTASHGWYGDHSAERGWLVSAAGIAADGGDDAEDDARIGWTIERLERPAGERPRLVLTYLEGPDATAHFEGLGSPALRDAIAAADARVGRLLDLLERRGDTALVVLTDHGMRPVGRLVNLESILRRRGIGATVLATGTVGFVYLAAGEDAAQARRKLAGHPAFEVFSRHDRPPWLRLGDGPRVPDLIVSAHPPFFIEDRSTWPRALRWLALVGPETAAAGRFLRASHGYPPATPGMDGVLFAWGPGVARGVEIPRVEAVDVHPTLARLLEIAPGEPVDGRAVDELFSRPPGAGG